MKRTDAFRKLRLICTRLDANDTQIVPFRLYLYGSVLTAKPDPTDIDLVLLYRPRPDLHLTDEEIHAVSCGVFRNTFEERARKTLCRGMRNVRLEYAQTLEQWANKELLNVGVQLHTIWEPGRDWQTTLREIESQPTPPLTRISP